MYADDNQLSFLGFINMKIATYYEYNPVRFSRFSFEEGKSDKEILDNLLRATRYDKRLLPPVRGKSTTSRLLCIYDNEVVKWYYSAFCFVEYET